MKAKKGQGCDSCAAFPGLGFAAFKGITTSTALAKGNFIAKINYYQKNIDPQLKRRLHVKRICRFTPTCSEYAKASIEKYGTISGIIHTAWRLMRCNPFSKGGHDPIK